MTQTSSKPVLGGRDIVRVAIVQKAPAFMDREASLLRAETLIAEAAEGGTDLIVFPEVWISGYPYWTEGWDTPLQSWAGGRITSAMLPLWPRASTPNGWVPLRVRQAFTW